MPSNRHNISVKILYTMIVVFSFILPLSDSAAKQDGKRREGICSVLDPRGIWPRIERIPLSPRPSSLEGKRIYLINSWGSGTGFEAFFAKIKSELRKRHPGTMVTIKGRNTGYSQDDPGLWQEMKANADAFIYAGAPSSSTTSYAFKWTAKLEKMGLPGAVLMFDTLLSVAETTRKREGAEVRYTAIPYPADTMDKSRENRAIDDILACLTLPLEDNEQRRGYIETPVRPRIMTSGSLDEIQEYFHSEGMSDGLPVIPPTEDRVERMLRGTSLKPDKVVIKAMMPEGLGVTVEKVAINAVMAGCEPRHLPVLLATLEAQGYTKQKIADYLVEHAVKPLGELRTSHYFRDTPETSGKPDSTLYKVFNPGSIDIIVAGGNASPMMQAWHMYRPVTVSIDKWK